MGWEHMWAAAATAATLVCRFCGRRRAFIALVSHLVCITWHLNVSKGLHADFWFRFSPTPALPFRQAGSEQECKQRQRCRMSATGRHGGARACSLGSRFGGWKKSLPVCVVSWMIAEV